MWASIGCPGGCPLPIGARPPSEAGFTLIEVIVALTIAGLGLAALFEAASGGLISADTAMQHTTAVRHAQSHLAELGITLPLKPGEQRGTESDGYRWRIRVTPVTSYARQGAGDTPALTLFAVETMVTWPAGKRERSVRLDSFRLGRTSAQVE